VLYNENVDHYWNNQGSVKRKSEHIGIKKTPHGFLARGTIQGKAQYLGVFKAKQEAIEAYKLGVKQTRPYKKKK